MAGEGQPEIDSVLNGRFKIVKRQYANDAASWLQSDLHPTHGICTWTCLDLQVPFYHCQCDLHTYTDTNGKRHTCSKRLSRPDTAIVKQKLRWWLAAGG